MANERFNFKETILRSEYSSGNNESFCNIIVSFGRISFGEIVFEKSIPKLSAKSCTLHYGNQVMNLLSAMEMGLMVKLNNSELCHSFVIQEGTSFGIEVKVDHRLPNYFSIQKTSGDTLENIKILECFSTNDLAALWHHISKVFLFGITTDEFLQQFIESVIIRIAEVCKTRENFYQYLQILLQSQSAERKAKMIEKIPDCMQDHLLWSFIDLHFYDLYNHAKLIDFSEKVMLNLSGGYNHALSSKNDGKGAKSSTKKPNVAKPAEEPPESITNRIEALNNIVSTF